MIDVPFPTTMETRVLVSTSLAVSDVWSTHSEAAVVVEGTVAVFAGAGTGSMFTAVAGSSWAMFELLLLRALVIMLSCAWVFS